MNRKLVATFASILAFSSFGAVASESEMVIDTVETRIEQPITKKNFDRGIESGVFMPKGTMFVGGTVSYTSLDANNYQFILLDKIDATSKLLSGRLFYGYTFANNVAAGVSFDYSRNRVDIKNVDISLSEDLNFAIEDYYSVQQIFSGSAFLRTYINIGNSKRFGLFNDLKVYFAGGQGKFTNGVTGEELVGTYEKITKLGLVVAPGVTCFATDFMTIEASIGILGVEYMRSEQVTNQVYQGSFESFDASFKLDLLSVGLGLAFYF